MGWFSSKNRQVSVIEHIVDNRTFLLGLDELYRHAMKGHERGELLACARVVAAALIVPPADVPIEGYYTEHPDLGAYFLLMRALQTVDGKRLAEVESLPEFRRLLAVTSSPIFGRAAGDSLLPTGRDPLSEALAAAPPTEWAVEKLTSSAAAFASQNDDYSLVGLACRAEDPVVIAALRESVVLYAERMAGYSGGPVRHEYVWRVDGEISAAGQRFVNAFNALFGQALPPATAESAEIFFHAAAAADIVGRCVSLGYVNNPEHRHYHWAVVGAGGQFAVHEFWAPEPWTTERYRRPQGRAGSVNVKGS